MHLRDGPRLLHVSSSLASLCVCGMRMHIRTMLLHPGPRFCMFCADCGATAGWLTRALLGDARYVGVRTLRGLARLDIA